MSKLDELKAKKAELERQIALVESYRPCQVWQGKHEEYTFGKWKETEPQWAFSNGWDYRQKPEPAVIYCNLKASGRWHAFYEAKNADCAKVDSDIRTAVPFKEVIE